MALPLPMTLMRSYFMNNIMGRVAYGLLSTYVFKTLKFPPTFILHMLMVSRAIRGFTVNTGFGSHR